MWQADRFIPLCDLARETKSLVVLESPPPYREKLKIDVEMLTGIIGMAGIGEDQIKLGFERQQNIIRAEPSGKGQLGAVTEEIRFRKEESQNQRQVAYDTRRQELRLAINYPDNEVKTSTATAKNLSRRLARALLVVPAEKYFTNCLFNDLDGGLGEKSVSGRAGELTIHTARIVTNILAAPFIYGSFSVIIAPRPLETIGILAVANMADAIINLRLAVNLINGKPVNDEKVWIARTIIEEPLRAIYPVSLVHEYLLPTARILAHNSVASTPLLKANEK